MTRGRKTSLSFCVLASFAVAVSCREPTQVTVRVSTGTKCSELSAVELVVGPDQRETQERFTKRFTTAVTRDCDPLGFIGTLVVAPGGQGATLVVAAGVGLGGAPPPEPGTCAEAEGAKRCIIARRTFSFLEHTSLTLPIELDPLCIGKTCEPSSTCFKGGCVDASVVCNGPDCGLAGENPGQPPGGGEGGANEASSSDGAYDAELDVSVGDADSDVSNLSDAMPDVKADGGTDATVEGGNEGGLDGSIYPPCGNTGGLFCFGGDNGISAPGTCTAPGVDMTKICCRCTCPAMMGMGSCTTMAGFSCSPMCMP